MQQKPAQRQCSVDRLEQEAFREEYVAKMDDNYSMYEHHANRNNM